MEKVIFKRGRPREDDGNSVETPKTRRRRQNRENIARWRARQHQNPQVTEGLRRMLLPILQIPEEILPINPNQGVGISVTGCDEFVNEDLLELHDINDRSDFSEEESLGEVSLEPREQTTGANHICDISQDLSETYNTILEQFVPNYENLDDPSWRHLCLPTHRSTPAINQGLSSSLPQPSGNLTTNSNRMTRTATRLLQHYHSLDACDRCKTGSVADENVTRYSRLRATYYQDPLAVAIPKVLREDELLGPRNHFWQQPSQQALRRLICGLNPDSHLRRPNISLACERPLFCPKPRRTFDIDSIIGRITSLAACRNGIQIHPFPTGDRNLHYNVNIKDQIEFDIDGVTYKKTLDLRHIPHYVFGHVAERSDILVYICFFRLYRPDQKDNRLSHSIIKSFFNSYVRPALFKILPSDIIQHIGLDFDSNVLKSSAKGKEGHTRANSTSNRRQDLSYSIPAEYLGPIWEEMEYLVAQNPSSRFRDMQILVDGKNLKLRLKSPKDDGSMLTVLDKYMTWLNESFDAQYVDASFFYNDLGLEITPVSSNSDGNTTVQGQDSGIDDHQTYFWKSCCMPSILRSLYGNNTKPRVQEYHNFYLQQAINTTSDPRRRSEALQCGQHRSMFYAIIKEPFDAAKTWPFQNSILDELAIPDDAREAVAKAAKAQPIAKRVIVQNWTHSKTRTAHAIVGYSTTSFGVRHETRLSLQLLQEMKSQLESLPLDHLWRQTTTSVETPPYIWVLPTASLGSFISETTNKVCAAVEMTLSLAQDTRQLNWAQTQFILGMIHYLRNFHFAGDIKRNLALAIKCKRTKSGRLVRGLNLITNMKRFGFAFPDDIFDWKTLSIKSKYRYQSLCGPSHLAQRFSARYNPAANVSKFLLLTEHALDWLRLCQSKVTGDELILYLAHIVLRQLRCDVFSAMVNDLDDTEGKYKRNKDPPADFTLNYETVHRLTGRKPHLINGLGRTKIKTFAEKFNHLYGQDNQQRHRWTNSPFRSLMARILQALEARGAQDKTFKRTTISESVKYDWLYPSANLRELHQKDSKLKARPWWSLVLDTPGPRGHLHHTGLVWEQVRGSVTRPCPAHAFGRERWQPGVPPPLPDCTRRDYRDWKDFFERHEPHDSPLLQETFPEDESGSECLSHEAGTSNENSEVEASLEAEEEPYSD